MLIFSRSSPLALDEINAVFLMSNNANTPNNVSFAKQIETQGSNPLLARRRVH